MLKQQGPASRFDFCFVFSRIFKQCKGCILNRLLVILQGMCEQKETKEEAEWNVEKILKCARIGSKLKFLVKWVGFDNEEDNTWEPMNNLNKEAREI